MLCECGCSREVTKGSRFIHGHNRRGLIASAETLAKRSATLREPEFNKKWREKISAGWTEEARNQMSKTTTGRTLPEEQRKKIAIANTGKKRNKEQTEKLKEQLYQLRINLSKHTKPTKIEIALYNYLELQNIIFEKQKKVGGGFIVDAYIPHLNLVIEADGKYWHSTLRGLETDKRKNEYLINNGYNLLRLSEDIIKSNEFKQILDNKIL